jgi:NAD+ kinase
MTIGIFANAGRDPGGVYAREVCDYVTARGHLAVECPASVSVDCLAVLGGDGTMLRAARYAAQLNNAPLLGINLGHVGYLTAVTKENGLRGIQALLDGSYTLCKRMMLEANNRIALNDAVLRGEKLTRFIIYVNGNVLTEYRADGVIVSTPTGATAYNRSAGGPLLETEGVMFAVTPICAADPTARPWVLNGENRITVKAERAALLSLDGEPLPAPTDAVCVKRAQVTASLIIPDRR